MTQDDGYPLSHSPRASHRGSDQTRVRLRKTDLRIRSLTLGAHVPFNLFAIVKDHAGEIDNASLMRDLKKDGRFKKFRLFTEDLHLPKTTIVVMEQDGWRVRFFIRPGEDMTLDLPALKKAMGKNAVKLPADFLDYRTEIAFGFADDPDQLFTDDVIEVGEFVRANYPGVIYDQYNKDLW